MAANKNNTILRIRNLRIAYGQGSRSLDILSNLSFDIQNGEIVSVLGESGSGKTTLLKAITGLLPPSANIKSGTLEIGGDFFADLSKKPIEWGKIRGRRIAVIFQDAQLALNPVMTIRDHFLETLLFHKIASAQDALSISFNMLSTLNFTDAESILNSYPFQLSGGMCQRVCIALSLCLEPKILIADEPTSALDTVSQKEVLNLLVNVQKKLGLTVLLITHDIAVARAVSNRVIILDKGSIVESGYVGEVFSHPQAEYTRQLISSRTLPVNAERGGVSQNNGVVLEVVNLVKEYSKDRQVLRDVNLTLHEKEVIGILGQSGCGKSTLAKCITRLEYANHGNILYRGRDITALKGYSRRETCKHIQIVFQDARASLNPRHTAMQLAQEPLRYLNIGSKREREDKARYYLDQVGISDSVKIRRPPQLSTGQCQRIAIARALILEPEILLCDEAVSALDMRIQTQILELLRRLHLQFQFSILMISHDIRVLRHFCDLIAVMKDGCFCEIGPTETLLAESSQPYTQSLLKCEYAME
jgi:peptide/nickel transport system ATP-binding protein